MDIYYTFYWSIFVTLIFAFSNTKIQKKVMWIWCIIFTLFGGLRWNVGGDWEQYYEVFKESSFDNIFTYVKWGGSLMEPGFMFINAVINEFFYEFFIYNLIVVGFGSYTIYKFCMYFCPRHPLMMFCFMGINFAIFPVRAGLSVYVLIWAYRFVKEQRLKPFLITVVIASLIHQQCVAFLPVYWLGKIKLNLIYATIIFMIFAFVGIVFQDYFKALSLFVGGEVGERAAHYTEYQTEGYVYKGANFMGWTLNYFFMVTYFYLRKIRNLKDKDWYNAFLNAFIIHIAIFMVFSNGMGDLTRLAGLFVYAQIILMFDAIEYFTYNQKKRILKVAAISFLILYSLYKVPQQWSGYYFEISCIPYKTIFE